MDEWRILDFSFPEELPFNMLRERNGEDARLYVTIVGDNPLPTCLKKDLLVVYRVSEEEPLKMIWSLVSKAGDYMLWQPVPVQPKTPVTDFHIMKETICVGRNPRGCEWEDDGYCTYKHPCASQRVHPVFVKSLPGEDEKFAERQTPKEPEKGSF